MTSVIARNVKALRTQLGLTQQAFAERLKVQQSYISKWEADRVEPEGDSIAALAALAGCTFETFKTEELGVTAMRATAAEDPVDMVGIQHIDMAYGLGVTFAVDHPEVEVLQFPEVWVRTITHSPPEMLTWTRGKGDSMEPTIYDGDLVMIDRSQRAVRERDALWAFTIGEDAAIKRLRRKGEHYEILSDNQSVRPDSEPTENVNIVGRVVFVGSRK